MSVKKIKNVFYTSVVLVFCVSSSSSFAEPIRLKCACSGGTTSDTVLEYLNSYNSSVTEADCNSKYDFTLSTDDAYVKESRLKLNVYAGSQASILTNVQENMKPRDDSSDGSSSTNYDTNINKVYDYVSDVTLKPGDTNDDHWGSSNYHSMVLGVADATYTETIPATTDETEDTTISHPYKVAHALAYTSTEHRDDTNYEVMLLVSGEGSTSGNLLANCIENK